MVHVVSETGGPKGKDYCILYNPQWAHLPHDLSKAVSAGLVALPAGGLCAPLPAWGLVSLPAVLPPALRRLMCESQLEDGRRTSAGKPWGGVWHHRPWASVSVLMNERRLECFVCAWPPVGTPARLPLVRWGLAGRGV